MVTHVVAGVADTIQVETARTLLWDWLEGLGTGIERDKPSTWKDDAWPDWPGIKKYGSCKRFGAAHQGATWYLRGLPNLKKVFSTIYKTEELIVSMDGIILWRPWKGNGKRRPGSSRLHVDQNPSRKPGFHCVQGMLPLYPVNPDIGGTVVVPRSHQTQNMLLSRHKEWISSEGDYCVLHADDLLQGQEVLIQLQPGDLLLWDSRLVHAGNVGEGSTMIRDLSRASLCVCMGPRERATEDVISKRKEAVKQGWCFSHWPWEAKGTKGQVKGESKEKYDHLHLSLDQTKLV